MTIGIDIDNTLTKTYEKCLEYFEEFETPLSYERLETVFDDITLKFANKYLPKIQAECELKPNAKEVLKRLKEKGHKIIFITARGTEIKFNYREITENYFKRNDIPYDELVFCSVNKGLDSKERNVDILIDDRETNLDSASLEGIIPIKFKSYMEPTSKYKMFDNWLAIEEYIDKESSKRG